MPSPTEVWSQVLDRVQDYVGPKAYEAWFLPTKCVAYSAEGIRIQVPNQFFADWLKENYMPLFQQVLGEVLPETTPEIDFAISDEPLPADWPLRPGVGSTPERQNPVGPRPDSAGLFPAPPRQTPKTFHTPPAVPATPQAQARRISAQLNSRYSFDTFVVGKSNQFASAASKAVAENPGNVYNPLFVYGGVGLGKTHILQAIGHAVLQKNPSANVHYVSAESFMNDMIHAIQTGTTLPFKEKFRTFDLLLMDDIQFLAGKESTQEEFFHTFNALWNAKKQIVLTSDRPPKEIANLEERLISRFEWGLVADVGSPDLETRIAILRKKAELENLSIPDDVLLFIARSIRSNIRQLEGSLIRLLAFSSLTGQDLSVDLARDVLKDFLSRRTNKATVRDIIRVTAGHYDVSVDEILSRRRTADIALARQVAMYFTRQLAGLSLSQIGLKFGGRDHSTVLHACQKVERLSIADDRFRSILDRLADELAA